MNLEQSVSLEGLKLVPKVKPAKQKMSALQMARHIFKISAAAGHPYRNITPEQWARKWLVSPVFILAEVETDKVALIRTPRNINKVLTDLAASASHQEPVVVDMNRNRLAAKSGFVPKVIAVDGAHRAYGEYLRGRDLIKAWVGSKALERIRPEPLFAESEVQNFGITEQGTKISTAATLYAAQGMPSVPRQDVGDGGSQPTGRMPTVMRSGAPDGSTYIKNRGVKAKSNGHAKDCKCAECREDMAAGGAGGMGGPGASMGQGSGPTPKFNAKAKLEKMKARRTPEAESSGHLNEPDPSDEDVPPSPSDTKQAVDPSDRLNYEDEPQHNPPGVKGWSSEMRGKNNPVSDSPGSGVGPRLKPDRGASNSELQRSMKAKGCSDCPSIFASAKHVTKIWNDFKAAVANGYKPRMEAKAPPGCEAAVMGLKKSKVDNPFAVAWWMKNQGRC